MSDWIINNISYIWIGAGVLFLALEILAPGFIIFWFGIGALITAFFSFTFVDSIPVQICIFLLVSLLSLFIWFKVLHKQHKTHYEDNPSDDFTGVIGECIEELSGIKVGKVMLDKPYHGISDWKAKSKSETIYVGERIKVLGVDGITLIIKKDI